MDIPDSIDRWWRDTADTDLFDFLHDLDSRTSEFNVADQLLLMQYEVTARSWQNHASILWRIPSYIAAIDGAFVLVAFRFLDAPSARFVILLLATVLTFVLLVTVYKIYYFMIIEAETIQQIEKKIGIRHRQFQTSPEPELQYWYRREGSGIEALSATKTLIYGMWFTVVVLFGLVALNGYLWATG